MHISFILVSPAVPENVGAAARAIKTMGYNQLRLVNPCDHLCNEALMLAHGSNDILHNATVYSSLEKALDGIDFSIATTAKQRWVKQNVIGSRDLADFLKSKSGSINDLAIVFGGEESGLSNQEIAMCDRTAAIPMANAYPSLNLAQAVMVFAYSLSSLNIITSQPLQTTKGIENHGYGPLKNRVIDILNQIGITEQSMIQGRILERLSEISDEDVNLLHSVTSKLKEVINKQ